MPKISNRLITYDFDEFKLLYVNHVSIESDVTKQLSIITISFNEHNTNTCIIKPQVEDPRILPVKIRIRGSEWIRIRPSAARIKMM